MQSACRRYLEAPSKRKHWEACKPDVNTSDHMPKTVSIVIEQQQQQLRQVHSGAEGRQYTAPWHQALELDYALAVKGMSEHRLNAWCAAICTAGMLPA